MKAKIINNMHQCHGDILNIKFLSYERVAGLDQATGEVVAAGFEEVEFIFDAPWEEEIITNREILTIKKPREASYYMYYTVIKTVEEHINEKIRDIVIVNECENDLNKVWIKNVYASANGRPVSINIVGKNNRNSFDIKICDVAREDFINFCENEISKLKIGLDMYTKRINGLLYTMHNLKDEELYTCTLGLNSARA